MTSLKDGDLQHSSALAQSPKGDIEPQPSSQKLIRNRTASRSRSDGRSRRYVQYRADQSQTETIIAKLPTFPLIYRWLVGCCGFTTVPVTKTIRLSEWVTPGDTAIPGMTSLKDGDLQHSSALAQSPKEI